MVFSDLFFLFAFLPAFFLVYLLAAGADRLLGRNSLETDFRCRNFSLVVFSLIFYAWGEPVYVFLMLACVLMNYVAGIVIDRQEKHHRAALVIGLACNILILANFKYLGFLAQTLFDVGIPVSVPHISLPIGISFYTFQSISYLIDVYRRQSPVQRRFVNLLLYISMFPQLIAGPIVRYDTVAREIQRRHVSADDVAEGMFRFFLGLGKKVILANQLSELSDQFLVGGLSHLTTTGAWIGIVAYTLQIYFDFSGYSDMAIGLGRCLGFHFNENFDHPYCCTSISGFWRRWHISLGSFFRDYVYIPMGGNRRHQVWNILVVWFLTGMWHGASWNFILWGLYFGLIVMTEKYTLLRVIQYIPRPLLHVYSLLLIVVGWGIFYFDDFGHMATFFRAFTGQTAEFFDIVSAAALTDNFWLWVVALVFCLPVRRWASNLTVERLSEESILRSVLTISSRTLVSLLLLAVSVCLLVGATNNAFIYTRF